MRTVDLPVGSHVTYNRGSSNYPSIYEAYVIAHRPKGTKYSSWGGKNGNNDTIGIAYARTYAKDANGLQIWDFDWVRPAVLEETWDEYQETQKRIKDRDDEIKRQRRIALKARKNLSAQIPLSIKRLFSDYEWDRLVERDFINTFSFSMDRLVKIIEAAQAEVPDVKAARIAAEVNAALQLL